MLFERARGGGSEHMRMETWAAFCIHSRLKMPGSSEKDRPLADPCISRPPPRCYDPDPLRSLLSAAPFPELLEGRRGGDMGHYAVLLGEYADPSMIALMRWRFSSYATKQCAFSRDWGS